MDKEEVRGTSEMEVDDSAASSEPVESEATATRESTTDTESMLEEKTEQQTPTEETAATRQEKKRAMVNLISRVQDTFNGLDRYAIQLARMKEEHLQHLAQLQDMEAYHKEMLKRLQVEHDRLLELQGELGIHEQKGGGGGGGGENTDQ